MTMMQTKKKDDGNPKMMTVREQLQKRSKKAINGGRWGI